MLINEYTIVTGYPRAGSAGFARSVGARRGAAGGRPRRRPRPGSRATPGGSGVGETASPRIRADLPHTIFSHSIIFFRLQFFCYGFFTHEREFAMKVVLTNGSLKMIAETELEETSLKILIRRRQVRVVNANAWEETREVAAEFLLPEFSWGT